MKKIINNADNFVMESIEGLVISYPETYKFSNITNIKIQCSVSW